MRLIVPAARRGYFLIHLFDLIFIFIDFSVISHQLNSRISCFVQPVINNILSLKIPVGYLQRKSVDSLWKNDLERVVMALKVPPTVPACMNLFFINFMLVKYLARLLLLGNGFLGQTTHFLPVLINQFDHLPVFSLSCEQIFASGHSEENVSQIVRSALRATSQGSSVVLLIPSIDVLELTLSTAIWKMVFFLFYKKKFFFNKFLVTFIFKFICRFYISTFNCISRA